MGSGVAEPNRQEVARSLNRRIEGASKLAKISVEGSLRHSVKIVILPARLFLFVSTCIAAWPLLLNSSLPDSRSPPF